MSPSVWSATGNVSDDTNSGNQTDEFDSFQQPFVPVIFTIIGVVGTLGNVLVCVVITSTMARSRSGTTNLLILNQAAVDALTSFILILIYTLPYPDVPETGGWAEFICRMWVPNTLLWMLFVVSTFNLCMMSLERYTAVAYPVLYSTKFRKQTALAMILFSWTVAPLLHYYYPLAYDYNDGGVCRKRARPVTVATIGVMVFIWEFFVPFVIMSVVYSRIVYLLRKQQLRVRAANVGAGRASQPGGQPRIQFQQQVRPHNEEASVSRADGSYSATTQGHAHHHQQRRAPSETVRRNVTVTLLSVFIMYVICWMPNHLTFLQFGLGGPLNLAGAWYYITLILAYLNMSINPFIYALKYKVFKEGFRKLFCDRCYGRPGRRNRDHSSIASRPIPTISGSDRS